MEYERLTDRDITKVCFDTWELCGLDGVCKRDCREPEPCKIPQMILRLAKLEDKIENGTLVEIPCIRYETTRQCWQVIHESMGVIETVNCGSKESAELYLRRLQHERI